LDLFIRAWFLEELGERERESISKSIYGGGGGGGGAND